MHQEGLSLISLRRRPGRVFATPHVIGGSPPADATPSCRMRRMSAMTLLTPLMYLSACGTWTTPSMPRGASRPCGRRLISLRQRRPSSCSRCACRVGRSRSRTRRETKHSRRSAPAPRRAAGIGGRTGELRVGVSAGGGLGCEVRAARQARTSHASTASHHTPYPTPGQRVRGAPRASGLVHLEVPRGARLLRLLGLLDRRGELPEFPWEGAGSNSKAEAAVEQTLDLGMKNGCIGGSFGCIL